MNPYFEGKGDGLESDFFVKQSLQYKGRTLPAICQRKALFLSWESRLPSIVKMIHDCSSDVVCLQEVQCSNASCAEPKLEQLIGGNVSEDKGKRKAAQQLIERLQGVLKAGFWAENPETFAQQHERLCAVLRSGRVREPATLMKKNLKAFYATPSANNVKIVVVKKMKIPIFVDGNAFEARVKEQKPIATQLDGNQTSEEYRKLLQDKRVLEREKSILEQTVAAKERIIEVLSNEKKWLQAIAICDKPADQRRHDLARDAHGIKQAKQQGTQYFLLVVIKAGFLQAGRKLEYVLPELPIYQQFQRDSITVLRIIDLDHCDAAVKTPTVKCVDGISVSGSDIESVVLLQVSM